MLAVPIEAIHPPTARFEVDWVIGNHADELVPWIPVMVARSPPNVKYAYCKLQTGLL